MKIKIISILMILVVSIITFFVTIYLASRGMLDLKVEGATVFDWLYVILDILMTGIIIYDYLKIKINKREYGDLKYILKRINKKTQIIGFIFLVCIFIFEVIFMFCYMKDIKFRNISLLFLIGIMPVMFLYRNIEKEGLAEKCVYFWGNAVEWKNINSYDINGNILTLYKTNKMLGMKEIIKIPFRIDAIYKDEIFKFVEERVKLNTIYYS